MSKIRFGCYFIPEEGKFYQDGSAVTGYDLRSQQRLSPPSYIRPDWQTTASEYGFHITVTDAIDIDSEKLSLVMERIHNLLVCFNGNNQYVFTKNHVGFWDEHCADAALILTPNRSVEMLHDVLVSILHPLGVGSAYYDAYKDHRAAYFPHSPSQVAKTEQFYAPYVFDEFVPHFTCINPFTGVQEERRTLENALSKQFDSFKTIEFRKLSLVAKAKDEAHYKIVEEFSFPVL